MIQRFNDWLESRTGAVSALKDFLTEDVPGGASYWYVFGSATLIILVIQIVTGILLTFYYAPSSATAWESTKFIYDKVVLGKFIISVHSWGASVMIVLVTIHLLQVTIWGAYKKPREVMYVVGVLMFVLTLVLGLTGYLLPWDLNAYFASQVSINIAGSAPFAGQWVQNFLQDGPTMGTLTINRFFGLHVWLVPIVLLLLVGTHLYIFRHNGPAGPTEEEAAKKKIGRFYPDQIFMDTVVAVIAFVVVVVLAIAAPPELLPKAQPSLSQFQPFPAWYFMPLYGMLRMVSSAHMSESMLSSLDVLVSIILPTLFVLVLLLLPWIDRNPSRSWRRRPYLLAITAILVVGVVGIGFKAYRDIKPGLAANDNLVKQIEAGQVPGIQPAVAQPVAVTGGAAHAGALVFSQNCASCHAAAGQGTPGMAPPLANNPFVTGDAAKVIAVVRNGMSGQVIGGQRFSDQMPAWKSILSPKQIADVITFIRSSWGNKAGPVTEAQVKASK